MLDRIARTPALRVALVALMLAAASTSAAPPAHADDPNPTVRVETPLGTFVIELFPEDAPNTVANFLKYVNDGDYERSFVHRSAPGFVIQGGGFVFVNGQAQAVPRDPPIANEFNRSNIRGTVAMAKVAGDPDSAASQWFINLANNISLDTDNGGYTVFGQIDRDGMVIVDAIAGVPIYNTGGAFNELPLINYTSGAIQFENLVTTTMLTGVATPTPSVLLRRSTNRSWLSYLLSTDDDSVSIEEKGSVKLTRSKSFDTVSRADFDGDGLPDVLLRDTSETGRSATGWSLATLVGKKITSDDEVAIRANTDDDVISTGDADGDGKADVLVRSRTDGSWTLNLLDVQFVADTATLAMSTDLSDEPAGNGDFNGDGTTDVLLRRANGSWLMYLLEGTDTPRQGKPKLDSKAGTVVEAITDLDGNGTADVLMRDDKGRWSAYMLDGSKIRSKGSVDMGDDLSLVLMATADFSGDGNADALLRDADGDWLLYALDGRKVLASGSIDLSDDLGYSVVSTGDFNKDGKADLLLRHTDGRWLLYTLDGSVPEVISSAVPKLSTSKSWVPQID